MNGGCTATIFSELSTNVHDVQIAGEKTTKKRKVGAHTVSLI
jgi:hypothetical protein